MTNDRKLTLEQRVARLEQLLKADRRTSKNEGADIDLINKVAVHLKNALDEMNNLLALEKEWDYPVEIYQNIEKDIEIVKNLYELYQ